MRAIRMFSAGLGALWAGGRSSLSVSFASLQSERAGCSSWLRVYGRDGDTGNTVRWPVHHRIHDQV